MTNLKDSHHEIDYLEAKAKEVRSYKILKMCLQLILRIEQKIDIILKY